MQVLGNLLQCAFEPVIFAAECGKFLFEFLVERCERINVRDHLACLFGEEVFEFCGQPVLEEAELRIHDGDEVSAQPGEFRIHDREQFAFLAHQALPEFFLGHGVILDERNGLKDIVECSVVFVGHKQ